MSDEELLRLPKGDYGKRMEAAIAALDMADKPRLLLHACCAPCSSYCLETLLPHFDVTVYFYNPNITDAEEYHRRAAELERFLEAYGRATGRYAALLEAPYEPEAFYAAVRGHEDDLEGGVRCMKCFRLRLSHAAAAAVLAGQDFFTTTLTISPMKNAAALNAIGAEQGAAHGVPFLPSDFKKKGGYARSVALSEEYGLYRQDYCGCAYSLREARSRREQNSACGADKKGEEA